MADQQGQNQSNEVMNKQGSQTNDAPGKMTGDRGDAKADASGYRGNNDSTAGMGQTHVSSPVPERAEQQLNPSSPGDTGTTPGSNAKIG